MSKTKSQQYIRTRNATALAASLNIPSNRRHGQRRRADGGRTHSKVPVKLSVSLPELGDSVKMNWSFDAGCTSEEYVLTPRRSQSVEMRLISWLWTNHSRHLLNLDIKYLSKWCPLRRMVPGHLASGQTKRRMSDSFESFQRCLSVSLFPGNEEILCTASIIQQLAAPAVSSLLGKDIRVSLKIFYNTLGGC